MLQEAESQTVASETIRGVTSSNRNVDSRRNRSERAFFGNAQESEIQKYRPCKVCKGHHGVLRCDKFKDLPVQERWNTAKRLKLCFRCLGGDHHGQTCVRTRVCAINNWKDNHYRLLHVSKEQTQADQRQPVENGPTTDKNEAAHGISNTKSETKPENEKPRLDEDGQMRCDSRLKYAEFLSHDARFPIILPRIDLDFFYIYINLVRLETFSPSFV